MIQGQVCSIFYFLVTHSSAELLQDDQDNVAAMDRDFGDMDSFSEHKIGLPPGDEGFDISYKGREHEVFEKLAQGIANLTG